MSEYKNITETGPLTNKEIKEDNNADFSNLKSPAPTAADFTKLVPPIPIPNYKDFIYEGPESSPIQQQSNGDYLGKSRYDKDGYINEDEWLKLYENPNELRAQKQSAFNKYVHGITKGAALAGTTFLDGTLGLLYAIPSAMQKAAEGGTAWDVVSQIWANDLSNALQNINDKMEEWLPNYRTQNELERKWWQNVGTANLWADGFLKNLGFAVGAFYSGAAWTKGLKALGLLKTGAAAEAVGSLLSGFNEGRIEANNAQKEFITEQNGFADLEREKLADEIKFNDSLTEEEKIQGLKELDANREKQKEAIQQNSNKMGLAVLIANTALLTASNMIQFGRLYRRGFDNTKTLMQSISSGMEKKGITGGLKEGGKYIAEEITKGGAFLKGIRNASAEGFEEMNQLSISNFAKHWFGGDSPDAYHLALSDPNAKVQSRDFFSALGRGIVDAYGNGDNWEEFAIGFLTGAIGMPTFGKANNSSVNTWIGRGRNFGISGGIIGEYRSSLDESRQNVEDSEVMNKYLDKIKENAHYFSQSQSFTNAMQGFAAEDNKFEYENMEDNDDWAAMTTFARRGRLDDLLDMVDQDFDNISDEELEKIAINTTPNVRMNEDGTVDYEDSDGNVEKGGWRDATGKLMSETPEGREEMRRKLKDKKEKIINAINQYKKSIDVVRGFNLNLDEDQTSELAWLHWKPSMFQNRYNSVTKNNYEVIRNFSNQVDQFINDNDFVLDEKTTPESENNKDENKKFKIVDSRKAIRESIRRKRHGEAKKIVSYDAEGEVIMHNMKVISEFLHALLSTDSALQFGSVVEANPEIMKLFESISPKKINESMDDYVQRTGGINPINALLEDLSGLDSQQYKDLIRDIHDTAKIGLLAKQFNEKFKEFSENPGKLAENRNRIDKAKEKVNNFINKQKVKKDINSKSVSDLVDDIENGNINKENIESLKGTNAYNKFETAENIIKKKQDIKSEIRNSDADDVIKTIMENVVDNIDGENVDEVVRAFQNEIQDPENIRDHVEAKDIPRILAELQEVTSEFESINSTNEKIDAIDKELRNKPKPEQKTSTNSGVGNDPGGDNLSTQEQNDAIEKANEKYYNSIEQVAKRDSQQIVDEAEKLYNASRQDDEKMSDEDKESHREEVEDILGQVLRTYSDGSSYRDAVIELNQILDSALIPNEIHKLLHKYIDNLYNNTNTNGNDVVKNTDKKVTQPTHEIIPTYQTTTDEIENQMSDMDKRNEDANKEDLYRFFRQQQSLLPFFSVREEYDFTPFHKIVEIIGKKERREELSKQEEQIYDKYRAKLNYNEPYRKRIIAIGKYLEKHNAFSYVDNGNVKEGDIVGFKIDKSLNEEAGDIVVLITKNNQVIGSLPSLKFDSYTISKTNGLKAFLNDAIKQWEKTGNITAKSKINKFMIGQTPYIKERHTLNEIYGNKRFYLGIAHESGDSLVPIKTGVDSIDDKTMSVLRAAKGKSYLLLETGATGSRTYMPIPFNMPKINNNTANTKLGKLIKSKIESLANYDNKTIVPILNEMRDFLCVKEIHVNYFDNDNMNISFIRYGEEEREELFNGPKSNISQAFDNLLKLSEDKQVPFQISSAYINSTINGMDYNRLIGEIALINLDIGSTHTISNWFTINPVGPNNIILDADTLKSTRINPDYKPDITISWNNNNYGVDLKVDKIYNNDGTIYYGDDRLEILAYAESIKKNKTKPYRSKYSKDGKLFDPEKKKFIDRPNTDNDVISNFESGQNVPNDLPPMDELFGEMDKIAKEREKEWPLDKQQKTIDFAKLFNGYFEGGGASIENDFNIPKDDAIAAEILNNFEDTVLGTPVLTFDLARNFLSILKKYNPDRYNQMKQDYLNKNETLQRKQSESESTSKASNKPEEAEKAQTDQNNQNDNIANDDSIVDSFDNLISGDEVSKVQKILENNDVSNEVDEVAKTSDLNPENLKEIAENNGLIEPGEMSEEAWDSLTKEQQSKILGYSKPRQKIIMSSIINAYKNDYNKNSINSLIDNPKFRTINENETKESFDLEKEKSWLKRVLPQFSDDEHLKIINGLTKMGTNTEVYGMFIKCILFLNGTTQTRGTTYHEAFHAVFNTLLNDDEIKKVYEAGKKKFNKEGVALEEALAEDFRKYTQGIEYNDNGSGLVKFWRKLVNFVKKLFGYNRVLNQLYSDINKGLYADRIPRVTDAIRLFDKEFEDVRNEAIKNGQIILKKDGSFDYALATNGKRSNLNERQWLQVRTKAFKEWFGDWVNDPANASKVVDENGEPLMVWHGSKKTWTVYDKNVFKRDQFGRGIYLSEERDNAGEYGNVREFFVNAKNPFYAGYIYDDNGKKSNRVSAAGLLFNHESISKDNYVEELKKYINEDEATVIGTELKNSDAVVVSYRARTSKPAYKYGEIIVSNPNQIKSATDNVGTFSRENNDIRYREIESTDRNLAAIGNVISSVDGDLSKLLREEKDNLEYQRRLLSRGLEYKEWLSNMNNLDEADRQALLDFGLTEEDWQELDDDGRENALMCYGL